MTTATIRNSFFCGLALLASPLGAQTYETFTEPVLSVDVSVSDTGRVAEVKAKHGDSVQRGDVLMVLDSQVLEAARRVAEKRASSSARMRALEVEYELAQNRCEQLRKLFEEGAGSPEEVRRADADAEVARLNVEATHEDQELAGLQLAEIEARLEQRRIRSPVDGTVTDVVKEPGEYVSTTDPHVVTVVQLSQLRATFYLPTADIRDLRVGSKTPLRIQGNESTVEGTVEYVAPVTQADSGRVRVDVLIDNKTRTCRSGVRCIMDCSSHSTHDGAE